MPKMGQIEGEKTPIKDVIKQKHTFKKIDIVLNMEGKGICSLRAERNVANWGLGRGLTIYYSDKIHFHSKHHPTPLPYPSTFPQNP